MLATIVTWTENREVSEGTPGAQKVGQTWIYREQMAGMVVAVNEATWTIQLWPAERDSYRLVVNPHDPRLKIGAAGPDAVDVEFFVHPRPVAQLPPKWEEVKSLPPDFAEKAVPLNDL